ncbi:hypothetical protein NEOLEDRAFT_1152582 [Neolentinus lepideus HHB14362 ss-1]|uniref:Uncharacterized protein n=1 Tax=Neolentinus lepideus HHB14362 ss-1 TaxID=1314782 RepID=A0A165MM98_9AGAM|nr:hypothetical protein NEOLEDRAFT_1152582 [Neolentinus lepideus HHB14362 ss-1]
MVQQWALHDHSVFQLTPPAFNVQAHALYEGLGLPTVTLNSFWIIYTNLLDTFKNQPEALDQEVLTAANAACEELEDEEVLLLPNLAELCMGGRVIGDQVDMDKSVSLEGDGIEAINSRPSIDETESQSMERDDQMFVEWTEDKWIGNDSDD